MPYIHTHLSTPLDKDKETALKARFGQAITCFPGKTERWLMTEFTPQSAMWFHGEQGPMAMVEVALFGKASRKACDAMTQQLTDILQQELGLDPAWIYIKYTEVENWGWNGSNF